MLSENEKSWLEGRKVLCSRCDCFRQHIEGSGTCYRGEKAGWMQVECRFFCRADVRGGFREAAEFEAQCTLRAHFGVFRDWHSKFGFEDGPCVVCRDAGLAMLDSDGNCLRTAPECKLMWCRILTEMEIEA